MTSNQLAENSVIQLLNSVKLARDNAERADNRVDHSFYYALTIALEELQERRKADSEPVILYRQVNPVNGMKTYWAELDPEEFRHLKKYTDENAEFMTLYRHAQPVTVVPDKMTAIVKDEAEYVEGWNACRAAMLAAAPQSHGSEPATVPGKWIPVSERMPEKNQNVLISVNFDSDLVEPLICSARYTGSTFRRGEATVKPGAGIEEATHWMELPAAPQEVEP